MPRLSNPYFLYPLVPSSLFSPDILLSNILSLCSFLIVSEDIEALVNKMYSAHKEYIALTLTKEAHEILGNETLAAK
jgi:hypothetical protein